MQESAMNQSTSMRYLDKVLITTFLNATFPTFCKLLKDRTSPETLDAFEGLEEVFHLMNA